MVERWIGSTTRRRGASGGEFLQRGFAYTQSGGREREEGIRATRLEGKVCVWGGGVPQPSIYRGVGANPSPSPKPRPAAKGGRSGGQGTPPSRSSKLGFPLVWPARPYGALCPWPNAARALPHRPMPPPGRWGHVGPLPEGSRSFRYNTD